MNCSRWRKREAESPVKLLRSIPAIRRFCRSTARPLVLVPTMGALHAGHAALIKRARRAAGTDGTVLVSIFVNPAQFGPKEDFARYPRTLAADAKVCATHGADAIFNPATDGMYAEDHSTWVNEELVSGPLCGAARPGHFRGVCTVVLKLFTITRPDAAVFGLKDYQQCAVIRRMARDLNLPVRIIATPTVRERDGLALSSRNRYLSPEERAQAPVIRQALLAAQAAWRRGVREGEKLRRLVWQTISSASLARIEYVEVVDAAALTPVEQAARGATIAVAVFFGSTRLIDNLQLR
jgi:pantoate--beta-alanine ligase